MIIVVEHDVTFRLLVAGNFAQRFKCILVTVNN